MPMPMSLSASMGGAQSGSSSNAGISVPVVTPFNFDGSGWVVNMGGSNRTNAGGNSDANGTQQTPTATGGGGGILGGLNPVTLCVLAAAWLLLS